MICSVGSKRWVGRAVDLGSGAGDDLAVDLDPRTVAGAVRTGSATTADGTVVEIDARKPGPLYERVGCLTRSRSIRPRTALAVAARTRGWSTPVDDRLVAARDRLAAHRIEEPLPDAADVRRRVAEVGEDVERLRERAAEARGRRQAGNGGSRGVSPDVPPLVDAVRELSEAETEAAAAREEHRRARTAARSVRDRLRERMRLADEVANAERAARARLVERASDAYEGALAAVPGHSPGPGPFEAPSDAMALAVARVGDLAAPVVVACGRFECARDAARWLGAPVVRL